jgi:L-ribulose-5-phosphate 4-epimerase
MSPFLMGLDCGGRSVRCALVEAHSGRVIAATRPWRPTPAPDAGFFAFDIDTDHCWRLVRESVADAVQKADARPDEILGIAVTGMRFSAVVVGQDGEVLFAVPNRDARAAVEGIRLADDLGAVFNERAGHWPAPIFLAARLCWLAENAPDVLSRAVSALSLSDWVALKLTGVPATDPSQAGETLLFDLSAGEWAWDLIDRLGLPRRLFPAVLTAGTPLGALTIAAAEALGLRPGTPVAVGGADTQCGLLGAGVVEAGQLAVVAGSTTPLQLVTDRPRTDPNGRTWVGRHVVPGRWVVESNAGAMGDTLEWFSGVLYPDSPDPVARFVAEAAGAAPGAGGMLSSLGAQVMDAREMMSVPVGTLSLTHLDAGGEDARGEAGGPPGDGARSRAAERRADLARAILEGMAFALKANAAQLLDAASGERAAEEPMEIFLAGGMTRGGLWTQLVCDVLDAPLTVSTLPEASVLGAAICAGAGGGVFPDLATGAAVLAQVQRLTPDAASARLYHELYADWTQVREARAPADRLASGAALRGMMSRAQDDGRPARAGRAPLPARRRLRVLATADLDEDSLMELRELGDVTHASYREALRLLTGDDLVEALAGCDVFITEVDIVDADALARLPDLRVVAACRGHAVNVDLTACTALGVPVLHAPGRNAEAVADLTLAFMLALARKLVAANAFLRVPGGEAGDMGRMGQAHGDLLGSELWGKTVGLVGCGAVGRAVARRLRPFGARVLVNDPFLAAGEAPLLDAEAAPLDALLAASDIVSLHAPLTDDTRGLMGEERLAQMKPGAFLVNTARAALVQEDALLAALRSGRLGGAALDVFAAEPPAADDPLLALPNVIATPHVGGNTREVGAHQGRLVAADLRRMVAGLRPRHVLNPETLAAFTWDRARATQAALAPAAFASSAGPAVTDFQPAVQEQPVASAATPPDRPAAPPPDTSALQAGGSPASQMERVLRLFLERAIDDAALLAYAARRSVVSQYVVSDLGPEFFIGFRDGRVLAGMGAPPETAEVRLKAKGETLDAILSGRLNGNKAAMTGKLSFSGDVRLAMGMQRVQKDLVRLYSAAREEAGGIDFAAAAAPDEAAPALPAGAAPPPAPPDGSAAITLRAEVTRVAEELFAAQLITATGGNVSARIPGGQEAWITPSQLFKGRLSADMMVRIDLDGNAADADAAAPSSERLLHCEIYRARPDVEAVVHAHAAYATVLGMSGIPFTPVTTEAAFFGDIPRVSFIMPGSRELAVAAREALGAGPAVLLQNHGLVVAASSLRQAANAAEIIERVSQLIWNCYAVGKRPPTLPKNVLATLREIGRMMA